MKNAEKIYNYLFAIFCLTIPFQHFAKVLPNILLILLTIFFPYRQIKKSVSRFKKELIYLFSLVGVIAVNTLIFHRWEDFSLIVRLLYIPLMIILFSPIKGLKTSLKAFVVGSFFLLSVSAVLIGLKIINDSSFAIANGEGVNDLLFGHRPYLGFMYLMATFFSFYLAINSTQKILRILYIFAGIIFMTYIILIAARLSALSLLISLFLALIYFSKKIRFNLKWLFFVPLFLAVLFYGFSDNLAKRFYVDDENINFIIAEPRYYIWDCAYQIKPSNSIKILFGQGYINTENALAACYQQKDNFLDAEHKQWFIDSRFNTHNQFFDLYLSQGIVAFLLSVFMFLYLLVTTRKDFFSFGLVISLLLFFMVENVLIRQFGCLLIGLLLSFVFRRIKQA